MSCAQCSTLDDDRIDVEVMWLAKAVKRVTSAGSFGSDEIEAVFRALAVRFPSA